MNNSPTEGEQTQSASVTEPTEQLEQVQQTSAEQNQETNSREQSQGSVSDDTATSTQNQETGNEQTQTQEKEGGEHQTDDGLAKFAKGQGIENIAELSERELRFLKIAHDNQKAARSNNTTSEGITDATKNLGGTDTEARLANLEYERTTDKFWSDTEAKRDKSLEPTMVSILNEKVEQLTPMFGEAQAKAYAFTLSRDLDTLYGMAQLRQGANKPVDAEAIRREERESINRQMSASAPSAHATQGNRETASKVDENWIRNEYDPRNPEHVKLVDEYYGR